MTVEMRSLQKRDYEEWAGSEKKDKDFMINPRRWIHEKAKNQTLAEHQRQVIFLIPFVDEGFPLNQ